MKHIIAAVTLVGMTTQAEIVSEQDLLAAVLIAECGGEKQPIIAMSAVLEVVWQRRDERKQSFLQVLTQRKQFSCLNRTTPAALIARARKHPRWLAAWALAAHRPSSNFSNGANHYCRLGVFPNWTRGQQSVAVIGNHKFFKL